MRHLGIALWVALISACSSRGETTVRLDVRFDDSWGLGTLDVASRGRSVRINASHEVLIRVGSDWAEHEVEIDVAGYRGAMRYAFGRTTAIASIGNEVRAVVTLARLPCGAWCTEGATQCEGDAVVVCEQRDDDACMEWSMPVGCTAEAPSCSLGGCRTNCIDECADGEMRCAGPDGFQVCGNDIDSDPCRDWLPITQCSEGTTCSNGRCAAECISECADGAVQCQNGAIIRCADRNFDGCLEWGPREMCPEGQSCSAGVCRSNTACTDDCSANMCSESTFTQCGQYDLDPCLEPSPGSSCVPTDPCQEGRCTATGCMTTARVCTNPPMPICVDANTLRTYEEVGTCSAGECEYTHQDHECANCPRCGEPSRDGGSPSDARPTADAFLATGIDSIWAPKRETTRHLLFGPYRSIEPRCDTPRSYGFPDSYFEYEIEVSSVSPVVGSYEPCDSTSGTFDTARCFEVRHNAGTAIPPITVDPRSFEIVAYDPISGTIVATVTTLYGTETLHGGFCDP